MLTVVLSKFEGSLHHFIGKVQNSMDSTTSDPFASVPFKLRTTLEKRKQLSDQILSRHPTRVPLIVEPYRKQRVLFNRVKYLAPRDIPVCAFISELRKHCQIEPSKALFFYFGHGKLQPMIRTLHEVYNELSEDDGFLYVTYAEESCFGYVL